MGHVFPEQWERFVSGVPPEDRDGNLAAAYNRLLFSPDLEVRERASVAWAEWEDALVSLEGNPRSRRLEDPRFRLAFTRIVTHYFAAAAFLADDAITGHLDRIAHIPAVLVRGRLDIGSPLSTAWQLAKGLPRSELIVVEEAGHAGAAAMTLVLIEATDRFAQADRGQSTPSGVDTTRYSGIANLAYYRILWYERGTTYRIPVEASHA